VLVDKCLADALYTHTQFLPLLEPKTLVCEDLVCMSYTHARFLLVLEFEALNIVSVC
jgi:hypothetical protein